MAVFAQTKSPSEKQIHVSAVLLDDSGVPVSDGEYSVRFGIYSRDRTVRDTYPSDADREARVWEEVQTVVVKNGTMNAFLGEVTPFSDVLSFEGGEYFLGIRIGTDSEMIPRKKFGSFANAMNTQFLRGQKVGTSENDIVALGRGGKIDITQLPTGTSGNSLLLANNRDFTTMLDDVSVLNKESHTKNADSGTTSLSFALGSGENVDTNDFDIIVSNAESAPRLRYSGTSDAWQLSNNGTAFRSLATLTNGAVRPEDGGTGLSTVPLSGQLLVGNGLGGYGLSSLLAGNGVNISNVAENITIGLDTETIGITSTIYANSGLESTPSGLRLLGGCSHYQILRWNSGTSRWECDSPKIAIVSIKEDTATYYDVETINFFGNDFFVDRNLTEVGISIDYTNSNITRSDQSEIIAGAWLFGTTPTLTTNLRIVENGVSPTFYGTIDVDDLSANQTYLFSGASGTVYTSTNDPLDTIPEWQAMCTNCADIVNDTSGVLSVVRGGTGVTTLNDLITLATHTTGNYVATIAAGNGISGSSSIEAGAPTIALGSLTSNWSQSGAFDVVLEHASSELQIMESVGDMFFGTIDVGDLSGDQIYTFPDATGTVITTGNLSGITGLTDAQISDTLTASLFIGSGSTTTAIDLATAEVAGTLPIANGGTNTTTIGTAGTIAYSTGTAYAFSATGTIGQALISGGTGAPTWYTPTGGSILFAGTSGILQQDNTNFFWDDTNNRLGLGTAIPSTLAELYSSTTNPVLTITGAHATDYDPQIQFRTDASPTIKFSLGLDATDDTFKIYGGSGLSGTGDLSISSAGVVSIPSLELGTLTFDTDAGAITWTDMPVTLAASLGTVESYSANIDGNPLLTVYAESNGAGSIQNGRIGIGTITPSALLSVGSTSQFQVNTTGSMTSAGINSTGNITLSSAQILGASPLVFEGATDNDITTIFAITDPTTSNKTITFPDATGTVITTGNLSGITGLTDAQISDTLTASLFIGSGSTTTAIDLATAEVAGTLPIANGGTNTTTIGTAGTIAYSTGTAYAFSATGTIGQALISGGTGAPTWYTPTGGSILFAGTSGILQQDNANFFWDDASIELGIGTNAPEYKLDVAGAIRTGYAGTDGQLRIYSEQGSTDYEVAFNPHATMTANTTYTLPAALGADGTQLQTDAAGNLSWAAAGSLRSMKNIDGMMTDSTQALATLLSTNIYRFHYKEGMGTGDSQTEYVGIMADESPWAMHHGGTIVNPVNTLGYMVLGIQATNKRIDTLKVSSDTELSTIENLGVTIDAVSLKTNTNASSIIELQTSIDTQLTLASNALNDLSGRVMTAETSMSGYDTRIETLEHAQESIENRVLTLEQATETLLDFYNAFDLGNVLMKDGKGNVDLLDGAFRVKEVVAGNIVLEVTDNESPVIGSLTMFPKAIDLLGDKDEDGNDIPDGKDDVTGEDMTSSSVMDRDGKSVFVKTKAVNLGSRVFLTPKRALDKPLAVAHIREGEGFVVEVKTEITEEIPFDWIIVEER